MSSEKNRDFGQFTNCPGCRRACPVDQLTCDTGRGFFAERAAKEAERLKGRSTRSFFADTEARLAEMEKQPKKTEQD